MNWVIAGAFKVTGVQNEWTARMPSALAVLALGLTVVALSSGRGWMDAPTGLVAGLMAMTAFGLLAKARFAGAEIEGIYVPLAGIAMVCWMAWWTQRRSPWLTWLVPGIFLGLAMLAKGPLHVVFFYVLVFGVVAKARAWRELLHPAHFVGVGLMCGIFASWAVPYFQTEAAGSKAGKVWKDQLANRVTENVFNWQSYALNLPRGATDALPWLLFAPVVLRASRRTVRGDQEGDDRLLALQKGALLATSVCFFAMLLIPGVLPRYALPLGVPWAMLVALALQTTPARGALAKWGRVVRLAAWMLAAIAITAPVFAGLAIRHTIQSGFDWQRAITAAVAASVALLIVSAIHARREIAATATPLAIATALLLSAAALIYATAAVPWISRSERVRELAAAIDAAAPRPAPLVLFDPGFEPAIFYLRSDYTYALEVDEIPSDAQAVLARGSQRKKLAEKRPELIVARTFRTRSDRELLLLQRRAAPLEDAGTSPENPAAVR